MEKYYLVLSESDGYIKRSWFKQKKYADLCAIKDGAEEVVELTGILQDIYFDDEEYENEEARIAVANHPDFQDVFHEFFHIEAGHYHFDCQQTKDVNVLMEYLLNIDLDTKTLYVTVLDD